LQQALRQLVRRASQLEAHSVVSFDTNLLFDLHLSEAESALRLQRLVTIFTRLYVSPRPKEITLPVELTHQHVFELDELLDAMARALAADAGFLHAADGAAVND
jgi:hypothetical protein